MTESAFNTLARAPYVSLATTRRDGREVLTPVWMVAIENHLYCYSAIDAGKVKRIRRSATARLASCDIRGGSLGAWHSCRARLVSDADLSASVFAALRSKYGWQMRVADLLAGVSGRLRRRAVLQFSLN